MGDSNMNPAKGLKVKGTQKRPLSNSPAPKTPSRVPIKKRAQESDINGKSEISLQDILETVNMPRNDLQSQRESLEENFTSLEQRITMKFSEMMEDMKKQVREQVQKEKEKLEENIHANFSFLEDDLKSKMAVIDKTQYDLNDLEQYTRKNSVRLFGSKKVMTRNPWRRKPLKYSKSHST